MQTNNNVTWVMPALNSGNFIDDTLASIAAVVPSSHELIIYDNGSTDDTVSIAKSWFDGRISGFVVENEPLSLGLCRQRLLELARYDWIRLIDSDDIVTSCLWESQLSVLQSNADLGAVGTQMQLVSADSKAVLGVTNYPIRPVDVHLGFLSLDCPIGNPSVMMNKAAALAVGGYRDVILEDHEFWIRMLNDFDICNLESVSLDYRVHPASYTHQNARAGVVFDQQISNLTTNHSSFGLGHNEFQRFFCGEFSVRSLFHMLNYFNMRYGVDRKAVLSMACSLRNRFSQPSGYGLLGRVMRKALMFQPGVAGKGI
jgi:glycosyltransferase involved in cell wall biosynthesis